MVRRYLGVVALAGMLAGPAAGGEGADLLRQNLYAGTIEAGRQALAARVDAGGEPEDRFALGMLKFVQGIEGLAQALYRHGLAAPEGGPMAPTLTMPVPDNPEPERLDYATVRAILIALQTQLDAAAADLLFAGRATGAGADYVVTLDPLAFRLDLDGDGTGDETEAIAAIFARAFGEPLPEVAAPPPPPPRVSPPRPVPPQAMGRTQRPQLPPAEPAPSVAPEIATESPPEVLIGFDRADAIWLAGYANVVAAQADFLLAHDFSDFVNAVFHRFFPRAGLPMQSARPTSGLGIMDPESDVAIADVIAAIHTLSWPVVEPDRLKRVLSRARTITALSRENWAAILAETDDNRELLPSPAQTQPGPDVEARVTQEIIDAWLVSLDTVDRILDGELLLPHWRFTAGFDLKAYFETATRTDLVMILTGAGALPYLRDGPIADAASFAALNETMGENWLGFALWFN